MCGLEIEYEGERVLSIRGDQADPFSQGHLCPKAVAIQDIHTDSDRVRAPQKKIKGAWVEISWDEALDTVATKLSQLQERYGPDSVAIYMGNPMAHNFGGVLYLSALHEALKTRNKYSATSVDQLPHMLAGFLMFGHQLLMPVPDLDRTDFFLNIGGNPLASNGSIMTAPNIRKRFKALKARGGKLVVIDPRRTETSQIADQHLFISPGRDAFLLLAMLHTLFAENLVKKESPHATSLFGGGEMPGWVADFPPEAVAGVTGISAEDIKTLARDFCAARSAVCYVRFGACTQAFGALVVWLSYVLNGMTGNFDRAGGLMFTSPAADLVGVSKRLGKAGSFGRYFSRVRHLPEFGGEFPVSTLADEMETPGQAQIRGLLTLAGNPVLSSPNGGRLEKALEQLEFMASIDLYCNETSCKADILLPASFALEEDHFDLIFNLLSVRNTLKYSPALFERVGNTKPDWEIIFELAQRLQIKKGGLDSLFAQAMQFLGKGLKPAALVDTMIRFGRYGDWFLPFSQGLNLAKLKAHPHGLDLGALQPALPEILCTPDQKINWAPREYLADLSRLKQDLKRPAPEFLLIGRRQLRSNNSWMHNSLRLVRGKNPCTLLMHAQNAANLELVSGDWVEVCSATGALQVSVEVTDAIMPGVVSLPHGWGHDRQGVQLKIAREHAGVSLNDITEHLSIDALSGNAALNGVSVKIRKIEPAQQDS